MGEDTESKSRISEELVRSASSFPDASQMTAEELARDAANYPLSDLTDLTLMKDEIVEFRGKLTELVSSMRALLLDLTPELFFRNQEEYERLEKDLNVKLQQLEAELIDFAARVEEKYPNPNRKQRFARLLASFSQNERININFIRPYDEKENRRKVNHKVVTQFKHLLRESRSRIGELREEIEKIKEAPIRKELDRILIHHWAYQALLREQKRLTGPVQSRRNVEHPREGDRVHNQLRMIAHQIRQIEKQFRPQAEEKYKQKQAAHVSKSDQLK